MATKITKAEYKRRGQKAAETKRKNKLTSPASVEKNSTAKPIKANLNAIAEKIAIDNKAFNKLPVRKKRMAVAADVIAQLNAGKYKAANEGYINNLREVNGIDDVQELFIEEKLPTCKVCGLGACILSIAHLGDSLSVKDINELEYAPEYATQVNSKMSKVFGPTQAALIESAFEGGHDFPWSSYMLNYKDTNGIPGIEEAIEYYTKFTSPKNRLIAIMQNIIDNDGVFKPKQIKELSIATARKAPIPAKVVKSTGCGGSKDSWF